MKKYKPKVSKKKVLQKCSEFLSTNGEGVACFDGKPFMTSAGCVYLSILYPSTCLFVHLSIYPQYLSVYLFYTVVMMVCYATLYHYCFLLSRTLILTPSPFFSLFLSLLFFRACSAPIKNAPIS